MGNINLRLFRRASVVNGKDFVLLHDIFNQGPQKNR